MCIAHRATAFIGDLPHFQALARQMIEQAYQLAVPFMWIVVDTVYGDNFDLRNWLQAQGFYQMLVVHCHEPIAYDYTTQKSNDEHHT